MKKLSTSFLLLVLAIVCAMSFARGRFNIAQAVASPALLWQASAIPASNLISAEDFAKTLQSSKNARPIIIQVGSRVLYEQAHIPGSEYIGPASTTDGLGRLRDRMKSVAHKQPIIIYCGCCPWEHCPNVKPAFDTLRSLGFSNVKVLFLSDNFGTSWVDKGYPATRGQ